MHDHLTTDAGVLAATEPIASLQLIGERINPGFASSRRLLERGDIAGLQELARRQVDRGARCLSVNVGPQAERDPAFICELVTALQQVVDVPLAIDSPDGRVQEACLAAYDPAAAGGRPAIINSVAESRWELMALRRRAGARVLLMVCESLENGVPVANRSVATIHDTARRLVDRALTEDPTLRRDDLIIDVSVHPLASDTENLARLSVAAIRAIGADPELAGVHQSVGLSNLTVMLPKLTADGRPLRSGLENAFLTETVPHGLDWLLGTAGRPYRFLPEGDPMLVAFRRILEADGFDALLALRELYAPC